MPRGEKPRSEPEIIPPDQAERRTAQDTPRTRVFIDTHGTERVYVAKLIAGAIISGLLRTYFRWATKNITTTTPMM